MHSDLRKYVTVRIINQCHPVFNQQQPLLQKYVVHHLTNDNGYSNFNYSLLQL